MSPLDAVIDFIRRIGAPRVLALAVVTGLGVAGLSSLIIWGNQPEMIAVVRGVPLGVVGEAQQLLTDQGLDARLSESGAEVLVPTSEAARARVVLAQQGVASGEPAGFELFDEASWGMTDFTQRINYRRALEGELERSIEQMRGVRAAQVHLALQDRSAYPFDEQGVEASVLLSMGAGVRPSQGQVEAITFLVASAVDGLSSESVSILDDAGRLLSAAMEADSPARTDRRRLEMQYDLEEHLEARVASLLDPIVGVDNARVRVSAELDFEEVQRRTEAVDPNQAALTGEARSEIEPGDPSLGAASTIQNNTFEVTRSTELSNRVPGAVRRLSVAVAVNQDAVIVGDAAGLQEMEQLVARAVGLDPGRGDEISVLAVPFEAPIGMAMAGDDEPEALSPLQLAREFQHQILLAFGLLLAFILGMRGLSMARSAMPAPVAPALPEPEEDPDSVAAPIVQAPPAEIAAPKVDPASLVRAWLREA